MARTELSAQPIKLKEVKGVTPSPRQTDKIEMF